MSDDLTRECYVVNLSTKHVEIERLTAPEIERLSNTGYQCVFTSAEIQRALDNGVVLS